MHDRRAMRVAALALLAACGSSSMAGDDAPGPDGSVPIDCRNSHGRPVAFQADVVPIIGHCGSELCHGGLGTSWPYTSLVNVATMECDDHRLIVKPGDPMNSYLIQKLDNFDICMGDRMPKLGNPLSAGELQILIDWICGGAPNN
jgi:hypothetical protein